MSVVHLRNGRADARHRHTRGEGVTWCGKKLVGSPKASADLIDTFLSYGDLLRVTLELPQGTCPHCIRAFDAAYSAAFPGGPKPIATFKIDHPEDMARARALLSLEALTKFLSERVAVGSRPLPPPWTSAA